MKTGNKVIKYSDLSELAVLYHCKHTATVAAASQIYLLIFPTPTKLFFAKLYSKNTLEKLSDFFATHTPLLILRKSSFTAITSSAFFR